jgi:predicted Zn-dependent peptidase
MYVRSVLPNGLRILTCPMPHVRSATVCFFVGAGSRFEPPEKAGLSHFLEHMAFKGTRSYPTAGHISEAIEGVGGILDASTSPEVTAFWAKVSLQHFPHALDVLTEMILYPRLAEADVDRERRVIIEELHMVKDSPTDSVYRLIAKALWPEHSLGRDVAGTEEAVSSISCDDLKAYREQRYTPGRVVVVVAGAPPADEVEAAIQAALGHLSPRPFTAPESAPEPAEEPHILLNQRDTEQANFCLAVPSLSYNHPDRYVLLVLNTILGSGMSSRLFQIIREQRALAYSIHSSIRQYTDAGAVIVYAGVDPARLSECLSTVWGELKRFTAEEVLEAELARAKEYNKGRILLRMENSYSVASWYGAQEILLERIDQVDQVIAQIEAVQPADIRRLANELFRPERLRLAVTGPPRDEADLRVALGL